MKRLLKSWVFWAFAVPAAVLPFVVAWRTEEFCFLCLCGSYRVESNARFDVRDSAVYRGRSRIDRTIESSLYREFLGDVHKHRFDYVKQIFMDRNGKRFGAACRRSVGRTFVNLYWQSPDFSCWLKSEVAAGRISAQSIETEIAKDLDYPEGQFPFGWTPP